MHCEFMERGGGECSVEMTNHLTYVPPFNASIKALPGRIGYRQSRALDRNQRGEISQKGGTVPTALSETMVAVMPTDTFCH